MHWGQWSIPACPHAGSEYNLSSVATDACLLFCCSDLSMNVCSSLFGLLDDLNLHVVSRSHLMSDLSKNVLSFKPQTLQPNNVHEKLKNTALSEACFLNKILYFGINSKIDRVVQKCLLTLDKALVGNIVPLETLT